MRGSIHGYVPLVQVTRGGTVESIHHGALVVMDSRGKLVASVGDPGAMTFIRSAAKPFQLIPLLASGAADHFGFNRKELAVMIASHNGESRHLAAVRSILRKSGVPESSLKCGAHPPLYPALALAQMKEGRKPTALHNNCSGKHAGMLSLARFLKVSLRDYLSPRHQVQRRILKVISQFSGTPARQIPRGIDGCSTPTFALSLEKTALAYARLIGPPANAEGEAARRAVEAMRCHPEMVAGTGRPCTDLMRAIGNSFVAKIGAEGFYGMAYRDGGRGVGIALKIAGGDSERARITAAVELLSQLDLLGAASARRILSRNRLPEVRNVRKSCVGRITPIFRLS